MSLALILEDELSLATALKLSLKQLGYETQSATTIADARNLIRKAHFDLLLLDRQLPDGDSIELCRELRAKEFTSPILMLTASGETRDRVEGLRAGADDYLPKPFSWEELEARLSALERRRESFSRVQKTPNESLQGWEIDEKKQRILGPKGWVNLTSIEFKLMKRLMESPGEALSKKQLLQDVWGLRFLPNTRTIDWFIGRLRKHFEPLPQSPVHILTIRGRGYLFENASE